QHADGEVHDIVERVDHEDPEQHVVHHVCAATQARPEKPDHAEREIRDAGDEGIFLGEDHGFALGLCLDSVCRFSINHHADPVWFATTTTNVVRGAAGRQ